MRTDGWPGLSKLGSYHWEDSPKGPPLTYKETVRCLKTSEETDLLRAPRLLDSTQTRDRNSLNFHALTLASPTQLEITREETAPSWIE